jgi:DNA mismatch endonuclease, patch repair protein
MIDVVDKITRSRLMAGIRGPKLGLRWALHRLGLRYRLHVAELSGRPNILLPRHCAAIQVHGCVSHRHEHCCTTPTANVRFWKSKFDETVRRDKRHLEALRKLGWKEAIVWECSIRDKARRLFAGK